MAVVLLGTLRRIGPMLELAHTVLAHGGLDVGGLAVGSKVPPFQAVDAGGSVVTSAELLEEGAILLFLSVGCRPCREIATELGARDAIGDVLLAVVVTEGTDPAAIGLGPSVRLLLQHNREISSALSNFSTPQAFLIDRTAVVRAVNTPNSVADLENLAENMEGGEASDVAVIANGPRTHQQIGANPSRG